MAISGTWPASSTADREGVRVRIGARRFRRSIAVAVVPALLLLGSCRSVSPVCSDAQNLKDAVQGLTQVDVKTGGIDALKTAVNDVKSCGRRARHRS